MLTFTLLAALILSFSARSKPQSEVDQAKEKLKIALADGNQEAIETAKDAYDAAVKQLRHQTRNALKYGTAASADMAQEALKNADPELELND